MAKIEYKVCVVTVTYGARWLFLEQVLLRMLTFSEVYNVVVVNNASSYSVADSVNSLKDKRIIVIDQDENLGSAGGYKKGLEYALKLNCDYIMLLDDDNLPGTSCMQELTASWTKVADPDNKKALFCLREDRLQHLKIARGTDPYRYYLTPDNFLGFSVFRIFYNQFNKLKDKFRSTKDFLGSAKIPYVPYGGLFFHRSLLDEIGLPDERFYLYVDDSEFTYRITACGGNIWLIPSCKIEDIDKSQGVGYRPSLFRSQLLDQYSFRTYYHVRNMIYFNKRVAVNNNFIFAINKILYLGGLLFLSILHRQKHQYKKIVEAAKDGLNGNLGKKN